MKLPLVSKKIINEVKKLKEVKAIVVEGSYAYGPDKYSDLDLSCFCTKIPSANKRKRLLKPILLKFSDDFNVPKPYAKISDYLEYKKNKYGSISYKEIKHIKKLIKKCQGRNGYYPEPNFRKFLPQYIM